MNNYDLATLVATELGTGWTAECLDPDYGGDRAALRHTDGRILHFYPFWRNKDRVVVSGWLPPQTYAVVYGRHGEITVAASRTPMAIAREIERRLLPGYEAALAEYRTAKAADDAAEAARTTALARLAEALGEPVPASGNGDSRRVGVTFYRDHGFGSFRPDYRGETVGIELNSIPVELALRIATLVKTA